MSHKTFNLPDLGEGLPDATIVEWYVKVGDVIKLDENLVSMETAKAVVDVPSPVSGKVLKLAGAQAEHRVGKAQLFAHLGAGKADIDPVDIGEQPAGHQQRQDSPGSGGIDPVFVHQSPRGDFQESRSCLQSYFLGAELSGKAAFLHPLWGGATP